MITRGVYNVKSRAYSTGSGGRRGWDNEAIAGRFRRLAALMEIRGDDQFRIRSYRNAAEVTRPGDAPGKKIAAEEASRFTDSPGVARPSAQDRGVARRGTFDAWEKMTVETPETTLDILRVGGIGLKTAATLHQQFKITSLDDLKSSSRAAALRWLTASAKKARKNKESPNACKLKIANSPGSTRQE